MLNKALDVLPRLREQGFTETASTREAWDEFRETTDPVAVWLDRHTVSGREAMVSKDAIRKAYGQAADREGRPRLSNKAFGQAVKRFRPNVNEAQRTIAGKVRWAWLGIGLRAGPGSQVSRDSRDFPYLVTHRECPGPKPEGEGEQGGQNVEQVQQDPVNPVNAVNEREPGEEG